MSGTIYKNLALPGRFIYRLSKGIPSGSPFTSILGTCCNFLAWSDFLVDEFGIDASRFGDSMFGDDVVVSVPDDININVKGFCERFKTKTGYGLDPFEIRFVDDDNWKARPSFLKTICYNDLPSRLITDTMISASILRRNGNTRSKYNTLLTGLLFMAPFNFRSMQYIFDFRDWVLRLKRTSSDETDWNDVIPITKKDRRDNFSYKICCRNYLLPCDPNYEKTKDVDLGNKRKSISPALDLYYQGVPSWLIEDHLTDSDRDAIYHLDSSD
jgi:hypothetical protein